MAERSPIEWTDSTWNPVKARRKETRRTGLTLADIETAIAAIVEKNRTLVHVAVLVDFAETYGVTIRAVERLPAPHARPADGAVH